MKISFTWVNLIALLSTALFAVGCKKIVREGGDTLEAEAVFEEAVHRPQTIEPEFGLHINWEFEPSFGPYLDVAPEKYSTTFSWPKTGERFSIAGEDLYVKFISAQKGAKVEITYREIFDVTYDGDKVIEKKYVSLEVLDANPARRKK